MYFKPSLFAGVFLCLFAVSLAIPTPKLQRKDLISALQKFRAPSIRADDEFGPNEQVELYTLLWRAFTSFITLDDVKFLDSETYLEDPNWDVKFHNTHLRGIQKMGHDGDAVGEFINDDVYSLNFTANFSPIEFHSEASAYGHQNGQFLIGLRSYASVKNLKARVTLQFNYTQGAPLPIRILHIQLIGMPDVAVNLKSLRSQFGQTGGLNDKLVKHIQSTLIPRLLRETLSVKTASTINQLVKNIVEQQNEKSEVRPFSSWYDYAFTWFYDYKYTLCDSYSLEQNHTLELGQVTSLTISNGAIRGMEYIRRTDCGDLESCITVPCPNGEFIFDIDDVYIDYDIEAVHLGMKSTGKMTVTISEMKEKDAHTCKTDCSGWLCVTYPEKYSTEFLKRGKVTVDVEGLPQLLRPTHPYLISYAETIHAKLLNRMESGTGGDLLDHERCVVV